MPAVPICCNASLFWEVRYKAGNFITEVFGSLTWSSGGEYFLHLRGNVASDSPLWATEEGGWLTYYGPSDLVLRKARDAGVEAPALHAFRRGFAVLSLRNGADAYSLQWLMGPTSLAVLRPHLKQSENDLHEAHRKCGSVDNLV